MCPRIRPLLSIYHEHGRLVQLQIFLHLPDVNDSWSHVLHWNVGDLRLTV